MTTGRDLVGRLRASIEDRSYLPGRVLTVRRVAADASMPSSQLDEVRRGLRVLHDEGFLSLTPGGRVRIAAAAEERERPALIAAWLRELIQAGVYPPGAPLPTRWSLCRAMVSPERPVTRALHYLHDEHVVLLKARREPLVRELPFVVEPSVDLDSLLDRVPAVDRPEGVDLSFSAIRRACEMTRTWWAHRTAGSPEEVAQVHRSLAVVATYLVPWVGDVRAHRHATAATLRRTAVTAAADVPADFYQQVWRAACLGSAVQEVVQLSRGIL